MINLEYHKVLNVWIAHIRSNLQYIEYTWYPKEMVLERSSYKFVETKSGYPIINSREDKTPVELTPVELTYMLLKYP